MLLRESTSREITSMLIGCARYLYVYVYLYVYIWSFQQTGLFNKPGTDMPNDTHRHIHELYKFSKCLLFCIYIYYGSQYTLSVGDNVITIGDTDIYIKFYGFTLFTIYNKNDNFSF